MRKTIFVKSTRVIVTLFVMTFVLGCTVSEKSQRALKYSAQLGINKGGITENTDLSMVPNVLAKDESEVDAFSGATRRGVNAGAHVNKPLRYGQVETGITYMYNHQTFTYADQGNMFVGVRKLQVNQLMLPFTYNFVLFKGFLPHSEIQLKLGYTGQFNVIGISETGQLPEYSLNHWSNGATLGISAYLFSFEDGAKLGFYVDGYRGSRIFTDYYNQKEYEMPGSSFVKFGLRYQLKGK